ASYSRCAAFPELVRPRAVLGGRRDGQFQLRRTAFKGDTTHREPAGCCPRRDARKPSLLAQRGRCQTVRSGRTPGARSATDGTLGSGGGPFGGKLQRRG